MKDEFYVNLKPISKAVAEFVAEKGFYTPTEIEETDALLSKLMLVVTEVGEAAEAVRHHDRENFKEEMADTIIRVYDICGKMEIDLGRAIADKMAVNAGRPHKHGKHA